MTDRSNNATQAQPHSQPLTNTSASATPLPSSSAGARKVQVGGGTDAFGRAAAKVAVAQICASVGFACVQQSALEALSDIAIRYMSDVAKTAHFYAGLAGRTNSNAIDVILALEDLHNPHGYAGASVVKDRSITSSGVVKDLINYFNYSEEIPFPRAIPPFPVCKKRNQTPTFADIGEQPPKHIPPWLPAFPDEHTYKNTPVWNDKDPDPRADKMEQAEQRRKAEKTLLNLHKRLAETRSFTIFSEAEREECKRSSENPKNPKDSFLPPPASVDERPISPVKLPEGLRSKTKERVEKNGRGFVNLPSVLEVFAPALDAMKRGGNQAATEKPQALCYERPVHFKLDLGKKVSDIACAVRRVEGSQNLDAWFSREEEKDDKKKRIEQILKESMESSHDLVQH
eukprot:TRINITY_DN9337_c0_g1_i4.p1 TRINITY_DN9337_c0_g1~~TRINITY_DN9337_c0_g1_i4.p1  ORF type:complete len:400 (+),score=43.88 TRINITY_DN9337_c0_g1_i4:193-1392(+)